MKDRHDSNLWRRLAIRALTTINQWFDRRFSAGRADDPPQAVELSSGTIVTLLLLFGLVGAISGLVGAFVLGPVLWP